jgi:hypothetical protein
MTDEFRDKFRKDIESARTAIQVEAQRSELLTNKQRHMWEALRDWAKSEVDKVNMGGEILVFALSDIGEPEGFTIVYNRESEQRKASAVFNPKTHTIDIYVIFPGKSVPGTRVTLFAAEGQVRMKINETATTAEHVVNNMLSSLL